MKWILIMIFGVMTGYVRAQEECPVVTCMTWDEASMTALKERKMVFVAVGIEPGDKVAQQLFADEAVRLFLCRHAVGIGMDMTSEEGHFFEPKLLMYPWPAYAFFMPYGDLLAIIPAEGLGRKPEKLLELGREALERSEVRKNNSRSVQFREGRLTDLLHEAEETGKLVFVMGTSGSCQSCLLMEKNVLNLDEVADFYNRHFINTTMPDIATKYGATHYPCWIFLNGKGTVVYRAEGALDKKEFLELGRQVLKKAEGIVFESGTLEDLGVRAGKEAKGVMLDLYLPGGNERRQLEKEVFRDPEVATFLEAHFVCGSYDMTREEGKRMKEKYAVTFPQFFCFTDANGNLLHEVGKVHSAEELIAEAQRVVDGRGLAVMQARFLNGERASDFVEEYIDVLGRAGKVVEAGEVASVYLTGKGAECLKQRKYWTIYAAYVTDADSGLFRYVREHCGELAKLYGQEAVDRKIQEVWCVGAGRFVKETEQGSWFDESGFKEYVKRLKKEKVDGWRSLVRNARMEMAEKSGDWRVYTELAEERWNEEEVSEAELYSWGVKINGNCRDKSIRFKAARWFALAVAEMEKRERLTGKVNLTSYKGFFEKLVDELIR